MQSINDSSALNAEFVKLTKEFDSWSAERKGRLGLTEASVKMLQDLFTSSWMRFFLSFDPKVVLKDVRVPVLAINGSKDVQVLPDNNLKGIEEALKSGGNVRYEIKKLDGLNHLFQQADTGLMYEYAQIEQTIDPSVLDRIANWISKSVNK